MKRILLISALSLVLSGCVQNHLASAYSACETYPKWIDKAQCQDSVASQDPLIHQNTTFQEIVSYRRLLIEKVKNKKMTNTEAEYAFLNKIGDINRQLSQQLALEAASQPPVTQSAPVMPPPIKLKRISGRTTTCTPLGNTVTCRTSE